MKKFDGWHDLSRKQKCQYLWDYYRFHILAVILCIGLFVQFSVSVLTDTDPLMNVIMVNSSQQIEDGTDSFSDFLSSYGYNSYKGAVACHTGIYFYNDAWIAQSSSFATENYQSQQLLYALIWSEDYDIVLGPGEIFTEIGNQDGFADLSKILPHDFLEQFKTNLVYTNIPGETPYPYAIHLTGNTWLEDTEFYDDCYFGILWNSPHPEIAISFAEYLLDHQ